MKYFLPSMLIVAILAVSTANSSAQKAYEKEQIQINGGIDFLVFPYSFGYFSTLSGVNTSPSIPVSANVEYGFHEYVSLGVYAGYYGKSWRYTYTPDNTEVESSLSVISYGARGTLHGTPLINEVVPNSSIDEKTWDLYFSIILGLETTSWRHPTIDNTFFGSRPSSTTQSVLGSIVGARYMVNENFGAFMEVGRGTFGLFRLGLSFNL